MAKKKRIGKTIVSRLRHFNAHLEAVVKPGDTLNAIIAKLKRDMPVSMPVAVAVKTSEVRIKGNVHRDGAKGVQGQNGQEPGAYPNDMPTRWPRNRG